MPDLEYGLAISIIIKGKKVNVISFNHKDYQGALNPGEINFPLYNIRGQETLGPVSTQIEKDLTNAAGRKHLDRDEIEINFDKMINQ
ncbi:MAG: hypothetical protein KDF58_06795 [Alphaproteobacteria bacterium]|nr:hypothetical protein [Alphaproteobacteria bacterium]HPF45755.1 hypothetical protein [Emcibacteraceae bacterium]